MRGGSGLPPRLVLFATRNGEQTLPIKQEGIILMTKSDLISTIADTAGCSKASAETVYDRLIDKIASTIAAEGEADVRGLGIFKRERTEAREGRNPRTGEKIQIAAGYKVKFKPAKVLRDRLPATGQAKAAE
jgi:DNA-binding protein HU-beta